MDRPEVPPENRPSVRRAQSCPGPSTSGRRSIKHLLHAWTALRAFVANHHHVAGNDLAAQDRFDGRILAFENTGTSGEFPDRLIHTRRLDDATIQRDVAVKNNQTAILE